MSEYPIIFIAPMVRAILEGRQTQTRRVIKPQPDVGLMGDAWYPGSPDDYDHAKHYANEEHFLRGMPLDFSPYGQPGDLLWVRETFRYTTGHPGDWRASVYYLADHTRVAKEMSTPSVGIVDYGRTRPSIHMPRWASRLTLEITRISVERLQEITEEDAENEGVEAPIEIRNWEDSGYRESFGYRHSFSRLWDDINGGYPWDTNPWVWVIEFERLP